MEKHDFDFHLKWLLIEFRILIILIEFQSFMIE